MQLNYVADEGQTKFTYPFLALADSHVKVSVGETSDALSVQTLDTDYTIQRHSSNYGGVIFFEEEVTKNYKVVIEQVIPIQRYYDDLAGTELTEFIRILDDNRISFAGKRDGGSINYRISTATITDTDTWHHLVIAWDTTQATAADRVKMYLDGQEVTNFDESNDPVQNFQSGINSAVQHIIGDRVLNYSAAFNGHLSNVALIDGQALTPSSFGETVDSVWVPKDITDLTYGSNGFWLDFQDDTAIALLGSDITTNENDFTPKNIALTQSVYDSPLDASGTFLSINSDQTNFNLANQISISNAADVTVVIRPGVTIKASNSSTPAFTVGSLPSGSTLKIINQGTIIGAGGAGGPGGNVPNTNGSATYYAGTPGTPGGDALDISLDVTINNIDGSIVGGSGGGGGGAGYRTSYTPGNPPTPGTPGDKNTPGNPPVPGNPAIPSSRYGGGGGGGGAGIVNSSGGNGGSGSTSAGSAGTPGNNSSGGPGGASGGSNAKPGGAGGSSGGAGTSAPNPSGGAGGAAGDDIALNGNTVTYITEEEDYVLFKSIQLLDSKFDHFYRTFTAAGNRKKWTWSGWFKRGETSTTNPATLFSGGSLLSPPADVITQLNTELDVIYEMARMLDGKLNQRLKVAYDHPGQTTILPYYVGNANMALQWTSEQLGFQAVPIEIDTLSYSYSLLDVIIQEPNVVIDLKEYDYTLYDINVLEEEIISMDTKAYTITYPEVTIDDQVPVDTKAYTVDYKDTTVIAGETIPMDLLSYNYTVQDPTVVPGYDNSGDIYDGVSAAEDASGDNSWSDEDNATASDNTHSKSVNQTWTYVNGPNYGSDSNILYVYDFGIDIPASKTITGLKVIVEGKQQGAFGDLEMRVKEVMLLDNGSLFSGSSALQVNQALTTSDVSNSFGSDITLSPFGSPSLTGADVMSAHFGVGLRCSLYNSDPFASGSYLGGNAGPHIDNIRVQIYYDDSDVDTE